MTSRQISVAFLALAALVLLLFTRSGWSLALLVGVIIGGVVAMD